MSMRNREALSEAVAKSYSLREALRKLGLSPSGGNYESIKKSIRCYDLDTSHFTGQGHLRGKTHSYKRRPLARILTHGKLENTFRLKRRMLAEGYMPHCCECCKGVTWCGQPMPLELHHKDGDRTNNALCNLELLCPNCHALTDNYRGKNRKV